MAFRNLTETDYQELDLDVWRRVILASLAARLPGREADWSGRPGKPNSHKIPVDNRGA